MGVRLSSGWMLVLMMAVNLMIYLDRGVMSVRVNQAVVSGISSDMDLTGAEAGVLGSVFMLGFLLFSPVFAHYAFSIHPLHLVALGILVWIGSTLAAGLALDYWMLLVARVFTGAGEASFVSLVPPMLLDLAPHDRKTVSAKQLWQACFYLSIVLGIATGTVAGEGLEHGLGGWRWPFLLESMVMSPLAVLMIVLERDPSLCPNEEFDHRFVAQMKSLFCNNVYVTAMLGASVLMFTLGGLAFWGPDFLHAMFSISAWEAALSFSLVILFSGVIGTMLGAVFMDSRLAGSQQILASGGMSEEAFQAVRARLGCFMVFVSVTAGGVCGLVGVWVQQFLLFMLVLGFIALVLFISFAPAGMVILSCVERPLRGQAQGVFIFFVHLLGDFPSPYVLGFMKDHLGVRWSLFAMVAWMLLGASVLAIALIFSIRRVSSLYISEPEAKSLLKSPRV